MRGRLSLGGILVAGVLVGTGCTLDLPALDSDTGNFACSTDADCAKGYECDVPANRCVPEGTSGGGTDGGGGSDGGGGDGGPGTAILTVTLAGDGGGTVTSSPAGIDCPGTCEADFPTNQTVELTANPAAGSTFGGWGGTCSGTGVCSVTLDASQWVSATFTLTGSQPSEEVMGIMAGAQRTEGGGMTLDVQLGEAMVPTTVNDNQGNTLEGGATLHIGKAR